MHAVELARRRWAARAVTVGGSCDGGALLSLLTATDPPCTAAPFSLSSPRPALHPWRAHLHDGRVTVSPTQQRKCRRTSRPTPTEASSFSSRIWAAFFLLYVCPPPPHGSGQHQVDAFKVVVIDDLVVGARAMEAFSRPSMGARPF